MAITIPTVTHGFFNLPAASGSQLENHYAVTQLRGMHVDSSGGSVNDPIVNLDLGGAPAPSYLAYTGTPTTANAEQALRDFVDELDSKKGGERWFVGHSGADVAATVASQVVRTYVSGSGSSYQITLAGSTTVTLDTIYSTQAAAKSAMFDLFRDI